jgi:hypothetical protein
MKCEDLHCDGCETDMEQRLVILISTLGFQINLWDSGPDLPRYNLRLEYGLAWHFQTLQRKSHLSILQHKSEVGPWKEAKPLTVSDFGQD